MTFKKKIATLILAICFISCSNAVQPDDISKINGYWEIEKVIFPDGNEKNYPASETIDFFEISKNIGIRKKVKQQFNGKYIDNGQSEKITATFKDGKAFLNYETDYAKWTEEIQEISSENLVLKNEQNIEYHYKKPTPFSLK